MTADLRELISDTINTHPIRCRRCSGRMVPCSGCSADAVMLVVAGLVELIAAGFDERAEVAKVADREHRDIDALLAWESSAAFVRTHAPDPSSGSVEPQTSPGGTPERRGCPETVWDGPYSFSCDKGAVVGICATHGQFRPATSPTGDPTR